MGLVFSHFLGGKYDSRVRGNHSYSAHGKLACYGKYGAYQGDKRPFAVHVESEKRHKHCHDHYFVAEGVHKLSEHGNRIVFAREVPVEPVGRAGYDIDNERRQRKVGYVHANEGNAQNVRSILKIVRVLGKFIAK